MFGKQWRNAFCTVFLARFFFRIFRIWGMLIREGSLSRFILKNSHLYHESLQISCIVDCHQPIYHMKIFVYKGRLRCGSFLRSHWTVWHTGLSVGNDKDLLVALVADLKSLSVASLVDHRGFSDANKRLSVLQRTAIFNTSR